MHQAWHIFKKDVRYLAREIAFLLALEVALFWLGAHGIRADASDAFSVLVAITAAYTIARLIHAEALAGENQFWVTRPYYWPSLLAAKLLFILAFINLPILLAQTGSLLVRGFPPSWIVPGLLWVQILVLICVVLPFTVIAALTDGLATFFGAILVVALIVFGRYWFGIWSRLGTPESLEWLQETVGYTALALFAPPIILLQYKLRRTLFGRTLGVSLAVCGACAYMFISWRTLFPLQQWSSSQPVNVRISKASDEKLEFNRDGRELQLRFPLVVGGVPDGDRLEVDSYSVSLQTADGGTWPLDLSTLNLRPTPTRLSIVSGSYRRTGAELPQPLLDRPKQPLTLRATFYLTIFGNSRERTITLRTKPSDVMDRIQCFAGYLNNVVCQSPFRWPGELVSQKSGAGHSDLTRLISYSPFPATLSLAPIAWEGTAMYSETPLPADRPVTIQVEEPVAHLRREVEVDNLYLDAR